MERSIMPVRFWRETLIIEGVRLAVEPREIRKNGPPVQVNCQNHRRFTKIPTWVRFVPDIEVSLRR